MLKVTNSLKTEGKSGRFILYVPEIYLVYKKSLERNKSQLNILKPNKVRGKNPAVTAIDNLLPHVTFLRMS